MSKKLKLLCAMALTTSALMSGAVNATPTSLTFAVDTNPAKTGSAAYSSWCDSSNIAYDFQVYACEPGGNGTQGTNCYDNSAKNIPSAGEKLIGSMSFSATGPISVTIDNGKIPADTAFFMITSAHNSLNQQQPTQCTPSTTRPYLGSTAHPAQYVMFTSNCAAYIPDGKVYSVNYAAVTGSSSGLMSTAPTGCVALTERLLAKETNKK